MKPQHTMKVFFLFLFVNFSITSCSDDDPDPGCYQELGLKIIETIKGERGTIRAPGNQFCSDDYVIESLVKVGNRPLGSLIPCNLDSEFQIDGATVIYSGYVYERINDGDQCADFFEITEIRLNNQ
ncbi:hypothetical protein SAMN04488008_103127 [Maribacter orientalis]|uniref:Lipoprotein n=1 Tax=Maribacter orientalis TaxID=228957 RepID=A0A1H7NAN4_9FLAO|nr:hypothetical protein [Maribacter orientalis]SEL20524.1 hypothetical protein SAMN04488008_103127 [Maribacter orientalis]|tara:strand:+ start:4687 stop:5064 length:378 start_codon:yes stop_codon:yes gene_type:complete